MWQWTLRLRPPPKRWMTVRLPACPSRIPRLRACRRWTPSSARAWTPSRARQRQHSVHEVGGALGHAPVPAARAEAATLARERDQALEGAGAGADAGKPVGQDPAGEEVAELLMTLKRRLAEHTRKIAGRKNITVRRMTCRFLTIDSDWFVRAAEDALITSYKPLWNASGFGSHVPGRGRPGTRLSQWDQEFPPK